MKLRWVTWRLIPFSNWLVTMVSKSPNWASKRPFHGSKNGNLMFNDYLLRGVILQVVPFSGISGLGGGLEYFLFSPLLGEDSQF